MTLEALKIAVQRNEKYRSIKREETFKVLESSLHQENPYIDTKLVKKNTLKSYVKNCKNTKIN